MRRWWLGRWKYKLTTYQSSIFCKVTACPSWENIKQGNNSVNTSWNSEPTRSEWERGKSVKIPHAYITYPIQELSSRSRQDVNILRSHEESQEAHGEHFDYWQHRNFDRTQQGFSSWTLILHRQQKPLHHNTSSFLPKKKHNFNLKPLPIFEE